MLALSAWTMILAPASAPPPASAQERVSTTSSITVTSLHPTTTSTVVVTAPPAETSFHLEEGSPEEARLLALIEQSAARRRQLDDQISELDATHARLTAELGDVRRLVAALENQEGELTAQLQANLAELQQAKSELRAWAVTAYVRGRSSANRVFSVILEGRPTSELTAALDYAEAEATLVSHVVGRTRLARHELGRTQQAVVSNRRDAAQRKHELEVKEAAIDAAQKGLVELRRRAAEAAADQHALVGQVFANREEFEARFAVLAAESEELSSLLRATQGEQPDRVAGRGVLANPVPVARVTSLFGPRVHPIFGSTRLHAGIDLAAPAGTAIRAAADGVVVAAGPSGGYGNRTVIDHGGGLATVYAHQLAMFTGPGRRVRSGDVIGTVGCTGSCTGPHLHFEVRVRGAPVDPAPWF